MIKFYETLIKKSIEEFNNVDVLIKFDVSCNDVLHWLQFNVTFKNYGEHFVYLDIYKRKNFVDVLKTDEELFLDLKDKLLKISNEYDIENLKQKYSKLKKEMNIHKNFSDSNLMLGLYLTEFLITSL